MFSNSVWTKLITSIQDINYTLPPPPPPPQKKYTVISIGIYHPKIYYAVVDLLSGESGADISFLVNITPHVPPLKSIIVIHMWKQNNLWLF